MQGPAGPDGQGGGAGEGGDRGDPGDDGPQGPKGPPVRHYNNNFYDDIADDNIIIAETQYLLANCQSAMFLGCS